MKTYPVVDLTSDPILNPAWPSNQRPVSDIQKIVVHHEGVVRPHDYDNLSRYQSEAQYQNNNSIPGSVGIQYHYHIDNEGTISKLRPHELFLWHCGDYPTNKHSLAICMDGNLTDQQPTQEQFESLKQLLDELSTQHPEFPAVQSDVFGHRQFFTTNCPGDNLIGWVDGYRNNNGNVAVPQVGYDHPELQPEPAPAPAAPQPAPINEGPGSVLADEPEYIQTYKPERRDAYTARDSIAVDLEAKDTPKLVPRGTLVNVAGTMHFNGVDYVRTVYGESHNTWYGLPVEAFESIPEPVNITIAPTELSVINPGEPAPTSDIPVTPRPSLGQAIAKILAALLAPFLRFFGKKQR